MSQRMEMEAALEAVLFVSPDPVSRRRLLDLFSERDQEEAQQALDAVLARYGAGEEPSVDGRGVMVEEVAGGIRLVTRPEMNDWLRRFFESGAARKLSMGALETLAIIAYRQPVTAPEIQELRSVSPSGVLKTLLERRLIRIAGRKEVVGKPFLYATTQEFLLHFGLRNLKDLPPLEEFEEALAGEGLGELLGGTDDEEELLRQAAEIEEREEDRQDRAEREVVEAERAAADHEAEIADQEDPSIEPEDPDSGGGEVTPSAPQDDDAGGDGGAPLDSPDDDAGRGGVTPPESQDEALEPREVESRD